MITLHRLGHAAEPFQLNPDLIVTVEANPDTVVTLTTQTKIVVAEAPERVAALVQACRVELLSLVLESRRAERSASSGAVARRASIELIGSLQRAAAPLV